MGWAERANPSSWRNMNPDGRKDASIKRAAKKDSVLKMGESIRKSVAEYRKRRAAAQGINDARKAKNS